VVMGETVMQVADSIRVRTACRLAAGALLVVVCVGTDVSWGAEGEVVRSWDRNRDGKDDLWLHMQGRQVVRLDVDRNADEQPEVSIDYQSGRPVRLTVDDDHDGRPEIWGEEFVGQRPSRVMRDSDRDGDADMWIVYNSAGWKDRAERDTNGDGKADTWVEYRNGQIGKWQKDLDFDGTVDRSGGPSASAPPELAGDVGAGTASSEAPGAQ